MILIIVLNIYFSKLLFIFYDVKSDYMLYFNEITSLRVLFWNVFIVCIVSVLCKCVVYYFWCMSWERKLTELQLHNRKLNHVDISDKIMINEHHKKTALIFLSQMCSLIMLHKI